MLKFHPINEYITSSPIIRDLTMMMDHHRFIKSNKNSNVMIGGSGSRSSSSDTGDDLTTRNSATQDDAFSNSSAAFDHNTNNNSNSNNNSFYGSSPQPASIFGDEAFDKINIDFDSTMANDLEFNNPSSHDVLLSSSKLGGGPASDTSVNSEMYLDKFIYSEPGSEPKGMTGVEDSKIGIDLKLGDIGDELDTELMSKFLSDVDNDSNITGGGVTKPSNGVTSMDPFMESGTQKLYQSPLFDFDAHNPLPTTSSGTNSNNVSVNNSRDNSRKSDSNSNTANINISLKNGGSNGSLCDSLGSLPSISNIAPNEPFPTASQVTSNPMSISNNSNYNAQHEQQLQQQQQTSMQQQQQQQHQLATRSQQQHVIMMQRQQQLFLQQQQQQQHQMRQQQEQQQQANNNPQNSSISSIVNDQLSRLPQANELNKLGVAGLEQEKMKLINRLKQIERSGAPMNVGQQQDPHQQFVLQQQLLLRQHQQQQQQQSLRQGGIQGQINFQGQQQQGQHQTNSSFALNQQMIQQQNQGDMSGCGLGLNPRPMAVSSSHQQTRFAVNNTNMNMSNNSNNSTTNQLRQQQIQFANTTSFGSNNNNNNVGNSQKKNNVSSVMGSGGKETPLLSFLRNKINRGSNIIKNSSSSNSSNNIMSMPGQQQVAAPAHSNMNSSFRSTGSDILDAAPIDFSSLTNPLLRNQRNQMMSNLDRSVNRNNGVGGRFGGLAGRRGMSSQVRENMMQQMTDSNQLSKSCKELRTKKPSTDFYESAGIISRHASADNMLRRTSLTPGAAKAQNRRFSLGRSSNSSKLGGGSSGGNSSSRSLTSMNSTENLFPVKRGTSGGRGGHGAKHKLGSGLSRRTSSVPYITSSLGESTSSIQQQMEDNHPSQQNDGWP
jgi:hypothetical protein